MGLSGRKEKILQAVVDGYINSCEPISSAEIKERHLPALSTATIRNELAALEEMGYLVQPHTPDYKKAIVQLKADSKAIEYFNSLS